MGGFCFLQRTERTAGYKAVGRLVLGSLRGNDKPREVGWTSRGILCLNGGGADGRLGRAVVQQRGSDGVRPERLLQLQDEAEVLLADDLAGLRGQPFGGGLRGLAVGLACLRVHRAVHHEVLFVEGSSAFPG